MTLRKTLVASALLLVLSATGAWAQQQTGEIYGRAADTSGAVLPGATVTVAGPALIQPRVAVTSETGTYRIPELPIGTYSVTFELAGFRTTGLQDIRVTIGFRAQINAAMELSTVQETVTVTGASPLVDTREIGTTSTFDLETMQNIPSARDPWVMLERTPGIFMDRANVGGNQSGQQSGYISRGATTGNNKWSIDGVDITDMAATGASPIYYDFDMLEEMQVTTGGADVSQQTGGVGINLVTKSGTDRFKGNARSLITDEKFRGRQHHARAEGAGRRLRRADPEHQGLRLRRRRTDRQEQAVVLGQLRRPGHQGRRRRLLQEHRRSAVPGRSAQLAHGRNRTAAQLSRDRPDAAPQLQRQADLRAVQQQPPELPEHLGGKGPQRARRVGPASDRNHLPPEGRASDFGTFGWLTGPSPFWKAADQHVINDKWLVDVMWAHLGNNFVLDFHEDELRDVQPRFETSTSL